MPHDSPDHIPDTVLYRLNRIDWPVEFPPGEYAVRRGDDWLSLALDEPVTARELRNIVRQLRSHRVRRVA